MIMELLPTEEGYIYNGDDNPNIPELSDHTCFVTYSDGYATTVMSYRPWDTIINFYKSISLNSTSSINMAGGNINMEGGDISLNSTASIKLKDSNAKNIKLYMDNNTVIAEVTKRYQFH